MNFALDGGSPVGTLSARLLSTTLPPAREVPQSSAARQSSRYLTSSGRPRSSSTGLVCRTLTAATVQATAAARDASGVVPQRTARSQPDRAGYGWSQLHIDCAKSITDEGHGHGCVERVCGAASHEQRQIAVAANRSKGVG